MAVSKAQGAVYFTAYTCGFILACYSESNASPLTTCSQSLSQVGLACEFGACGEFGCTDTSSDASFMLIEEDSRPNCLKKGKKSQFLGHEHLTVT